MSLPLRRTTVRSARRLCGGFREESLLAALGVAGSRSGEPDGPAAEGQWVQVVAASRHTCALSPAGTVCCRGSNEYGQLGDGYVTPWRATATAPSPFRSLVADASHTYGLTGTNAAYCCGVNGAAHLCGLIGQGVAYSCGSSGESALGRTLPQMYATSAVKVLAP